MGIDAFWFFSGMGVFASGLGGMFYLAGLGLAKIGSVARREKPSTDETIDLVHP